MYCAEIDDGLWAWGMQGYPGEMDSFLLLGEGDDEETPSGGDGETLDDGNCLVL